MSLKIGIIGAGGMLQYHAAGFQQAGATIYAICDQFVEGAKKAAAKYGVPESRVFAESADMLKALPELDAVSVITPNKFHAPLSLQCLRAGKHVFCEKPPALSAPQMAEMKEAAEKAGKTLMFNFNNRARPESYAMMDYIRSGAVGRINSAQAKWIRRAGIPGFGGWFTNKELSGGGPLIDLVHMVDLALFLMGNPEPETVLAQNFNDFIGDKTFKGPWGIPDREGGVNDVENACHAFLRCKTGQVLFFQCSWAEMIKREEVSVTFQGLKAGGEIKRLFGVDGIDDTSIDTCELYVQENGRSVDRTVKVQPAPDMGRARSAANFVHAINGKEAPLNTPVQALGLMKIIDATYESARTGKAVTIA